ncbi:hypothetical protein HDU86_008238 [Geranomyces michiganensis]|nr:hypothetical protein HDU86_008238 [Geranomyces michiganensis]
MTDPRASGAVKKEADRVSDANLALSPRDLLFQPTRSNIGVIAKCSLQNVHPSGQCHVGYKLKTNAPSRYSVKPVIGVLPPGGVLDVLVARARSCKDAGYTDFM